jgi:hypothetical protein
MHENEKNELIKKQINKQKESSDSPEKQRNEEKSSSKQENYPLVSIYLFPSPPFELSTFMTWVEAQVLSGYTNGRQDFKEGVAKLC